MPLQRDRQMKNKELVKKLRTIALDLREPNIVQLAIEHQAKKLDDLANKIEVSGAGTGTNVSGAGTGNN